MIITIHTDGGARGNPGPAAIGVVIHAGDEVIYEHGEGIGVTTNNVAEYTALLAALRWLQTAALSPAPERVECKLDSLLVVQQLNGVYALKQAHLATLAREIHHLVKQFPFPIGFSHVPRKDNARADALVNQALDAAL